MKLLKTFYTVVLYNEITMDALQWLFILKLHPDFIRLKEEEREECVYVCVCFFGGGGSWY